MTVLPAAAPGQPPAPGAASWLRHWEERDPELRATKRALRAAVLVPGIFALADFGIGNSQTTLFAVFGAFALLLFADFGGPRSTRFRSYLGLFLIGAVLVTAGTICSSHAATAVVGMAVFGFAILFAGAVSPQAAVGATAALLTFVLPVAVPAGASAVGNRLAGWALAGAFCIPAVMLVWSGRWHDPLRRRAADAATAVADLVDAHAEGRLDVEARRRVGESLEALRKQYEATPYRPAGAGPTDTALVSLVSRLEWVGENALIPHQGRDVLDDVTVRAVHQRVSGVLRQIATLLMSEGDPSAGPIIGSLASEVLAMVEAREALTRVAWQRLVSEDGGLDPPPSDLDPGELLLWRLDPTYPIRILASATEMTADVAVTSARGDTASPWAGIRRFARGTAVAASARLSLRSVWFRNSLRGAAALAAAVAVVEATNVQHGFWVVLGTLSVLRSNAIGTGATALRAMAGTAAGVALGALVLQLLGHHLSLLWVVLPFAVLLAGVAPSAISFAAGQAGFTVSVVIIFNIIDPVGSRVGLIRIEDVAIGVVVSMAIGLVFWPRGASADLARSLCEAYAGAVAWMASEVQRFDAADEALAGEDPGTWALVTASRLDDAFRQFMNERGAKRVSLPTVTHLVTGCARVRLVALTLATLPHPPRTPHPDALSAVAEARRDVVAALAEVERWYAGSSQALGRHHPRLPAIVPVNDQLRPELLAALDEALSDRSSDRALQAMRLIWLLEHLDGLSVLQVELAQTADQFANSIR